MVPGLWDISEMNYKIQLFKRPSELETLSWMFQIYVPPDLVLVLDIFTKRFTSFFNYNLVLVLSYFSCLDVLLLPNIVL